MTKLYNHQILRGRRKELRKKPTYEESVLWKILKKHLPTPRFRRQYSVGPYILDFYSVKHRLCIELDGNHHLHKKEYDAERDRFLLGYSIIVIRFPNIEVRENIGEVVNKIRETINA